MNIPCENCITFMMCKNRLFASMKENIIVNKPDDILNFKSTIIRGYVKTVYMCDLLRNYMDITTNHPNANIQSPLITETLISIFNIKEQMIEDQLQICRERGYIR